MVSIREKIKKINSLGLLITLIIILLAFASFGLGRLSAIENQKEALKYIPPELITNNNSNSVKSDNLDQENREENVSSLPQQDSNETLYVGSKNSDKYHLPWCSGAQRIKDSNKIWFSSVEEAQAAGYKPAGNCPGL